MWSLKTVFRFSRIVVVRGPDSCWGPTASSTEDSQMAYSEGDISALYLDGVGAGVYPIEQGGRARGNCLNLRVVVTAFFVGHGHVEVIVDGLDLFVGQTGEVCQFKEPL